MGWPSLLCASPPKLQKNWAWLPIRLTGAPLAGGSVVLTTSTNSSGYYLFLGLAPGTYTVTHISFPVGYRDFGVSVCHAQAAAQGKAKPLDAAAAWWGRVCARLLSACP